MRVLAVLILWVLLATFAPPGLYRPVVPPARAVVTFEPVPLVPGAPERRRAGRLLFLGGWELTSNDPRFGGLSAMHVADGELVAVSDAGSLIRFALPGYPPAAHIAPLPAGPGSAEIKGDRDAESMVVHGSRAWIGFEKSNAVWRYRGKDWRDDGSARPPLMRRWRSNRGSEAMVRLPGGRFLVFSEGADGGSDVLLFDGDPSRPGTKADRLRYRPPDLYRITDAALLPDGRLLFLNRNVSLLGGIMAKLTIAAAPRLTPGSVLTGEEIATLERPLTIDNMEALSVTREGGRTILWIASDDNFNPLQRTLLLKFALVG